MSAETITSTDEWRSPRKIEEDARQTRHALFEQICQIVDDEEMSFDEAKLLFDDAATDQVFAEQLLPQLICDRHMPELTSH